MYKVTGSSLLCRKTANSFETRIVAWPHRLYLCFLEFIRDNRILNLRYSSKKSRVSENDLRRNVYELEKQSRGCINWSWFWDGLWCADLHDVVAEEHHLEEEGDDYVEEDDWDDEYPAHARVCLKNG